MVKQLEDQIGKSGEKEVDNVLRIEVHIVSHVVQSRNADLNTSGPGAKV